MANIKNVTNTPEELEALEKKGIKIRTLSTNNGKLKIEVKA